MIQAIADTKTEVKPWGLNLCFQKLGFPSSVHAGYQIVTTLVAICCAIP
ncbi:unnamed protein product [Fructobacillus cardui]|uniref:Uncharacterized protein n=1 Tax=Fructobacillus cardui TaxID=2893170 RepID=A0ABN9YWI1_9LACO|nr:hypothetical protein FEFB_08880 [Fructobacillus sp. EFB-N1]CAK1243341.1 unnamed protein product [Fructobacillus cardui]CAK1243779.1 unnamed protein product [Fructobacillus cardui]CAK1245858.1 unnamed protein product [Fructobacillus cardui]